MAIAFDHILIQTGSGSKPKKKTPDNHSNQKTKIHLDADRKLCLGLFICSSSSEASGLNRRDTSADPDPCVFAGFEAGYNLTLRHSNSLNKFFIKIYI